MKNFSKRFGPYLLLEGLFEGGRMFVGATSVLYLLSRNLTLTQIATLKSIQAAIFLLFDFPTGVLADVFGRKKSLLLSVFCAVVGFLVFYTGLNISHFIVAEALTALSLCFWSGAYDAFSIDGATLHDEPGTMDRFFHSCQFISGFSVLVFGFLGSILATKGLDKPYLAAIGVYLLIIVILWQLPEHKLVQNKSISNIKLMKDHFLKSLQEGLTNPTILPFLVVSVSLQFLVQPLLHYWQPFFLAIDPRATTSEFGSIFSLYCGASALFSFIYIRLSKVEFFRSLWSSFILLVMFSMAYFGFAASRSWNHALILFCLAQAFLAIARTSINARVNEVISHTSRASILSFMSFSSRFGMIVALNLAVPYALNQTAFGDVPVHGLFKTFSSVSLLFLILIFLYLLAKKQSSPHI